MTDNAQKKTTGEVLRELGKRLFSKKILAMHGICALATAAFLGTCLYVRGQTLQDDMQADAYKIGELGLSSDHANNSHTFCKPCKIDEAGGTALADIYMRTAEHIAGLRHVEPGTAGTLNSMRNAWNRFFNGQSADEWRKVNSTKIDVARSFASGFASDCPDDVRTKNGIYGDFVNNAPTLVINVPSKGTPDERAAAIANQIKAISWQKAHL